MGSKTSTNAIHKALYLLSGAAILVLLLGVQNSAYGVYSTEDDIINELLSRHSIGDIHQCDREIVGYKLTYVNGQFITEEGSPGDPNLGYWIDPIEQTISGGSVIGVIAKWAFELLPTPTDTTYQYTRLLDIPGLPLAINDSGKIVGLDHGPPSAPFIYDGETYSTLEVPGVDVAFATGINNADKIVGGYSSGTVSGSFVYDGFNYDFPLFPDGGGVIDINDSEVMVGVFSCGAGCQRGFVYDGGTYTVLANPNAWGVGKTAPIAINNAGTVVGQYIKNLVGGHEQAWGFIYDGVTYKDINVPGAIASFATGINDTGTIVGQWSPSTLFMTSGFVYDGNSYYVLEIPGSTTTLLSGINNAGDIVGTSSNPGDQFTFIASPCVVGEVTSVQGDVWSMSIGGQVNVFDLIKKDDVIETKDNGLLSFKSSFLKHTVDLNNNSRANISRTPQKTTLELIWGMLRVKVQSLAESPLIIRTPVDVSSRRGTEIIVETTGDETYILVLEGTADVATLDESSTVTVPESYGVINTVSGLGVPFFVDLSEIDKWWDEKIVISAASPVDLYVTDPLGRSVGMTADGGIVNEIPGANYTGPDAVPEEIVIIHPVSGTYDIDLLATGDGSYKLSVDVDTHDAASTDTFSGTIEEGETINQQVVVHAIVNEPPIAECKDVTVAAGAQCVGDASVDNGSYDPNGDAITLTQSPPGPYQLGDTPVTLTVTDNHGEMDVCMAILTVEDTVVPSLDVLVSPDTLWPPNHKMVTIETSITATDICDANPSVSLSSITMNEGDESNTYDPVFDTTEGDGNTINDIVVDPDGRISLRAERSGSGTDRVYTIIYTATDVSGNQVSSSATVTVPHNQ